MRWVVCHAGGGGVGDHDDDILVWSERQSALLRRRAAGEVVSDQELDWANLARQIESVGRRQLGAMNGYIVQALVQDLQAKAWPSSPAVAGWRAEAVRLRREAAKAFAPSMRQRIDMAKLYALAVRRLPETIGGRPPLPVPATCLVTLDALLAADGA